jgi:hypothetical protein
MCAAFALAPVALVGLALANLHAFMTVPPWFLGLLGVVYGVIPLALSLFVLLRQRLILHLLIGECIALVAVAVAQPGPMPGALLLLHYTIVIAMVVMAILLINRDILFPFAIEVARGFRRAPRIMVNERVTITIPRLEAKIRMMVEDASLTGIALYAATDTVEKVAADIQPGEAVMMSCNINGNRHEVRLDYVWQTQMSTVLKLGFRAFDSRDMHQLMGDLLPAQPAHTRTGMRRLNEAWARPNIRRVLNYALVIGLLSVMMLPPLIHNGPKLSDLPQMFSDIVNGKDGTGTPMKKAP